LVEAQARETPDARAVVDAGDVVTYQELNQAADRLARKLRTRGVGPGERVGLYVPRSIEMIVGVLGILKAGGAYVPLNPDDPKARIEFIIEDAEISIVVAPSATATDIRWKDIVCVPLDDGQDAVGRISGHMGSAGGDDTAYVLYTSGSTGRPKGVMMPHQPLVNLLTWQTRQPGFDRPARVLQYAPLGFDVSFQEIFSTLSGGGTLHLVDEAMRRDFATLLRYINDYRIERVFLPFVALQQLCMTAVQQEVYPRSLRHVITAGEQLKVEPSIRRFFKAVAPCTLHNQYGPTETHVVTQHVLPDTVEEWPELPPIGCPIANTSIYILDPHGQPVPVGVPGELHVGGDALATGYCNRPTETKHRFRSHALASSTEARLYATGDRAKYRSDGTIEFLGRMDRQVKIRGYRVEPGEVEAALARQPRIQQAAVRAVGAEMHRLVAYVISAGEKPVEEIALRRVLSQELADYMVPERIITVAQFPMTASGKVDYAALPEPERVAPNRKGGTKPRTERERLLTGFVADALQVDTVGVDENLFDLGLNSLMVAQIVRSVQEAKVPLTIRDFFAYQTIENLAERAEESDTARREREEALRARIKQMTPREVKRLLQEKRNQ
jgi:amino acid adenylation domain-containing protein